MEELSSQIVEPKGPEDGNLGGGDFVLRKLFGMINLGSLEICRQVCRKWDTVIDSIYKGRVHMVFGFDKRIGMGLDTPFCLTRRQSRTVEQQILDYESHANTDVPFTSFKFQGENIPWNGEVLQRFFNENEESMKELSVAFFWSLSSGKIDDFFDFINNILLKHAYKIQVLKITVNVYPDGMSNGNEMLPYGADKKFDFCQSLFHLEVFSIKFFPIENLFPTKEKNVFQEAVNYILSSSKSLRSVNMSCPMTLNAMRLLTNESCVTIKDLQLTYSPLLYHLLGRLGSCEFEPRFEVLFEVRQKGLQLNMFSAEIETGDLTKPNEILFQALVKFLNFQSKCLEILEINIETYMSFKFLRPFFPKFPRMEKLQTLKIIESVFTLVLPFEDRKLGEQFPALNRIEISIKFGMRRKESLVNIVRNFLQGFDMAGENLNFFYVCITDWFYCINFKMNNLSLRKCAYCFKIAKLKIPNLKEFKVSSLRVPNMASYRGTFTNCTVVPGIPTAGIKPVVA